MPRIMRTLELAYAGRWGQNGDLITEKDLKEVVETFTPRRPVGIGHDIMKKDDAPKYGNVWSVKLANSGKTLTGDVEFSETLDKLYTSGLYDGWSVSIPKRAIDGKTYLHHLAFLGATPPKIPGLKDLGGKPFQAADNDKIFSFDFSGKIKESDEEVKMTKEEIEAMQKENAELKEANKKLAENKTSLEGELKKAQQEKKEMEEVSPETLPKEFSDKIKSYDEEMKKMRLQAFKAKVENHLPKGVMEQAEVLASSLSSRSDAVNFSDNGQSVSGTEIELLSSILRKWPQSVSLGSSGFDYSDRGSEGAGDVKSAGRQIMKAL